MRRIKWVFVGALAALLNPPRRHSIATGSFLDGEPVNAGTSKTFQNVVVSGGGLEEAVPSVHRVTDEDGPFALQGVVSTLVGLPGGCHFCGTLIEVQ